MRVLIINGPNLSLLGEREPDVYGVQTLAQLEAAVIAYGTERGAEVKCFQHNHEGVLIDALHAARHEFDGIIFNPAAYTHYSYALRDAVAAIHIPVVEVHLSDIAAREEFRATSVIAPVCIAQYKGKGITSYFEAIDYLLNYLEEKKA